MYKETNRMSKRMSKCTVVLGYRIDDISCNLIGLAAISTLTKVIERFGLRAENGIVKLFDVIISLADNYRSCHI